METGRAVRRQSLPRLNDRRISALPIPTREQGQVDYWDSAFRGFGVRVSYGGKKVFVLRYRTNGRLRRMTLGAYPAMSLVKARKEAMRKLGLVADGEDPALKKQERRAASTFDDLAIEYGEMASERHKSWSEEDRVIQKDLLPAFRGRLLPDIRRRDVRELVEDIARKRKAPVMANRTLGVLSRMFNFALEREWLEANPASRIAKPGEERSRDRVLTDREIGLLWAKLEAIKHVTPPAPTEHSERQAKRRIYERVTPAVATAFQVQLLTAQRPGEVRNMKWSHVDLENGWWTIPATDSKNGTAHRVPLTSDVLGLLEQRKSLRGEHSVYVFENQQGGGSVAHRGKKAAALIVRDGLGFAFRAHDLRRTAATKMAEAGVAREHIAHVLNHVEGGASATRVYDRYGYDAEKRAALTRWAKSLSKILQRDKEQRAASGSNAPAA
jgi:integrase